MLQKTRFYDWRKSAWLLCGERVAVRDPPLTILEPTNTPSAPVTRLPSLAYYFIHNNILLSHINLNLDLLSFLFWTLELQIVVANGM